MVYSYILFDMDSRKDEPRGGGDLWRGRRLRALEEELTKLQWAELLRSDVCIYLCILEKERERGMLPRAGRSESQIED